MSESVLMEAQRHVHGARPQDYGTPFDNHGRTARLWSVYLGKDVTPEDVCMLNILQKVSRGINSITRDTLVDIAGYAANVEMVIDERERREAGLRILTAMAESAADSELAYDVPTDSLRRA